MGPAREYGPDRGPNTVADLDALPDEGKRYELVHGWLIEMSPSALHDYMAEALKDLLRPLTPPGHLLKGPWDVQMPEGSIYSPDVVLLDAEAYRNAAIEDRRAVTGDDVLFVAEVQRPRSGSWKTVHNTKVRDYALAGIPHYWIIDLKETPRLSVYRLGDDRTYRLVAQTEGAEALNVTEPFALSVKVSDLLPR
ncbi:Uma2 family endonuclease [Actinomadura parmotrematis]|uniref:Uma2 family endonuclease n=1 Tax=Actinomadura parmotrematis TaxID=2864039 RepID=A0ABS7FW62_9ACTN|nr:Uma2 family endonuclease [Actinomadura parmotrematis]MBW8484668.1 Uma2 family endonuclease [Actinomadura parmotrematis]